MRLTQFQQFFGCFVQIAGKYHYDISIFCSRNMDSIIYLFPFSTSCHPHPQHTHVQHKQGIQFHDTISHAQKTITITALLQQCFFIQPATWEKVRALKKWRLKCVSWNRAINMSNKNKGRAHFCWPEWLLYIMVLGSTPR